MTIGDDKVKILEIDVLKEQKVGPNWVTLFFVGILMLTQIKTRHDYQLYVLSRDARVD
jgi:hypothetical protein